MKIKLVAFDLDGTIGDTIPMCLKAFRQAVSPYAGHLLTDEEIIETFGLNELGMVKAIVPNNSEKAVEDYYKYYEILHSECAEPYDGIRDLVNDLHRQGVKVAVITGKGERSCRITLSKYGLINSFDDVLSGSEKANIKAESIKELLAKYNLSCSQCIYVGDAVSDVTESSKAGVICLSALWGTTANSDELRKVNPDNLFDTVEKLRDYLFMLI